MTEAQPLFPVSGYWHLYAGFIAFVLLLLALDLGVFHRRAHAVSFREAGVWSAVWVLLALLFNYGLYEYARASFPARPDLAAIPGFNPQAAARQVGLEFLAGYLVEKSLSIDNIFVFVVIFRYFGVPPAYQHRVLFYGILGALIFRAIFIALGAALLKYHWVIVVFGAFLILTGIKMLAVRNEAADPGKNPALRLFRRYVPVVTEFHGQRFFVRSRGVLHATPLLLALLLIEFSDVVFAVDSVPAIFALTREPFLVFTSNIFAILGLRSLYFLLAGAVERFRLLKYGLGLVLVFVGLKMAWLNNAFGGKFPIGWSLGIIAGVLAGSVLLSLLRDRRRNSETAGAARPTAQADDRKAA